LHTTLNALRSRTELPAQRQVAQLEALACTTTKGLANLAQQLVSVEQKLSTIASQHVASHTLPPAQAALAQTLEQVVSILHGNLTAARHALMAMFQEFNNDREQASD
jgi:hypothetical protein